MAVTADMVARFAEITGDFNPLHLDEKFAAQTRFKWLEVLKIFPQCLRDRRVSRRTCYEFCHASHRQALGPAPCQASPHPLRARIFGG